MGDEGSAGRMRRGFAPLLDRNVRLLILGSFPSPASLAAGQYYAHPRNQFWPIIGAILDEPLIRLPYHDRLRRLLAHRVGLWDVFAACRRNGSLDSQIKTAQSNDLQGLCAWAPQLQAIAFNGGAAGRFRRQLSGLGYCCAVMPSTSPAHAARRLEEKLVLWKAFIQAWC
jgi:hypoxanthine-DNA glycosylase